MNVNYLHNLQSTVWFSCYLLFTYHLLLLTSLFISVQSLTFYVLGHIKLFPLWASVFVISFNWNAFLLPIFAQLASRYHSSLSPNVTSSRSLRWPLSSPSLHPINFTFFLAVITSKMYSFVSCLVCVQLQTQVGHEPYERTDLLSWPHWISNTCYRLLLGATQNSWSMNCLLRVCQNVTVTLLSSTRKFFY